MDISSLYNISSAAIRSAYGSGETGTIPKATMLDENQDVFGSFLDSAIKNIMWSLQKLIFTHRDLQQLFTVYRISKESTCLWILETGL